MKQTNDNSIPVIKVTPEQFRTLLGLVCGDWQKKLIDLYGGDILLVGELFLSVEKVRELLKEGKPGWEIVEYIEEQWPEVKEEVIDFDSLKYGSIVRLQYSGSKLVSCKTPISDHHYMVLSINTYVCLSYCAEYDQKLRADKENNRKFCSFVNLHTGDIYTIAITNSNDPHVVLADAITEVISY